MKRFIYTLFLIWFVLLQSCSPKLKPYSAEVNFLYKEVTGTIAVKSTGYGKGHADAVLDAQKNAFKVLLFKGIPGTDLNVPLVENENEAREKSPGYFKKFFDEGYFKTFMMSSTESSNLVKVKGGKKISVDIKVNYNSLRKDLEQNTVVRKFGY